MRQVARVAWYRFRTTFGRRSSSYLALVLLIGLVGGLALGAVSAARRTQSSYPAFLQSTNPSDLEVATESVDPATGDMSYDAALVRKIARLPRVTAIATYAGLNHVLPLGPTGAPVLPHGGSSVASQVLLIGSVDGEFFDQDRVTVMQGRMADPQRADEWVATAQAARLLGLRIGRSYELGFYTNAQADAAAYGTARIKPQVRFRAELVGIVEYAKSVVQDDTERFPTYAMFTPALTRRLTQCCAAYGRSGLQLERGRRDVATVEAEIAHILPKGLPTVFTDDSTVAAKAERAIKPEAIALGVFGLIAALAALLIGSQVIGRLERGAADEGPALRALGASPAMTVGDGLVGIAGSIVSGSILAAAIAVGLSPLAPIGPVRSVERARSIAFDWTVLGVGVGVLIATLTAVAVTLAVRATRVRVRGKQVRVGHGSRVARGATVAGLSTPAVAGIRFALERGRDRDTAPVRSAIIGTALAVIVLAGSLTFGVSLRTLVSHPSLYGWNWNYELESYFGGQAGVPEQLAESLLRRDPNVQASTGVYFATLQIDGHTVPALGVDSRAAVAPPLLSGHGIDRPDEVVLGAATLAALHKHVGEKVELTALNTITKELRIVGTATLPTVGGSGELHTTMGTGALFADSLIPASFRDYEPNRTAPNLMFVRLRPGASSTVALHSLQRIATQISKTELGPVSVLPVQRPAEIVNYRSMGSTPALLGAALAVGAVAALALTLVASVRRRRRELALLKALGFTRRQLAAVVAWQSTIAVAIGVIIGVPLGIVAGRSLWNVFAHAIHAVPQPTVSAVTMALIAIGALVLANLVAALPGLQAARTRTAVLLRAE